MFHAGGRHIQTVKHRRRQKKPRTEFLSLRNPWRTSRRWPNHSWSWSNCCLATETFFFIVWREPFCPTRRPERRVDNLSTLLISSQILDIVLRHKWLSLVLKASGTTFSVLAVLLFLFIHSLLMVISKKYINCVNVWKHKWSILKYYHWCWGICFLKCGIFDSLN